MPSKSPIQRLSDILENIEFARQLTHQMSYEEFAEDRKTQYAVVRALEIISEASRRLPEELKARHSEIPWKAVAAVGNVLRHEYEEVDPRIVWRTVKNEIVDLESVIHSELRNLSR